MRYFALFFAALMAALTATPALADSVVPGQAASAAPSLGRSINDEILVDGSPAEAARSSSLTPGGQQWQMGREQTRIDRVSWTSSGRPEAEFDRILSVNRRMCVRTVVRMMRYADLATTFQTLSGLDSPLAQRYISMGGKIQLAAGVRQIFGLGQIGAGLALGGPVYAGIVGGGVIGHEAQGQVHDESMLLNRDHGIYTLVATVANIEANLLSAEANIDYWEFIYERYCERALERAAANITPASPPDRSSANANPHRK